MQNHRNDAGEQTPRPANPSPPLGNVHGLGESHALRVDLQPVQLPWLADEIDTVRATIREEHDRALARYDELPPAAKGADAEAEVHRRAYQLRVLAMIREQLPLSPEVATASIASAWEEHDELVWELARITAPITVVGPARAMLVLVRGSARNVADALAEALRGPRSNSRAALSPALHWPEWTRTTAAVASRLRDMAAAAERSPTPTSAPCCSSPTASTPTTIRSSPTSSGSGRLRQGRASCQSLWSAGVGGPLPDLWASL